MAFKHKDLLSLRDVEREEIEMILSTAASMRPLLDSPTKKTAHLQGKSIVTLFYENSTRTRMSFELASKYMGAAAANISASASSVSATTSATAGESISSSSLSCISSCCICAATATASTSDSDYLDEITSLQSVHGRVKRSRFFKNCQSHKMNLPNKISCQPDTD